MIPPVPDVLRACAFLAKRYGWELSPQNVRLLDSIKLRHQQAAALAASPEDEPAALFFAFSLDLGVLGEDVITLPMVLSRNQTGALKLVLRASRYELVEQARAVSAGFVTFPELRAWFAARLVPVVPSGG
ncbi:MAG: hypothetical protein U0359_10875 [Byssovorax sp.]